MLLLAAVACSWRCYLSVAVAVALAPDFVLHAA